MKLETKRVSLQVTAMKLKTSLEIALKTYTQN